MTGNSELFWCTNCLSMSTRPRITFDQNGHCNACQWSKKKQTLNWDNRMDQLYRLVNEQKAKNRPFDCLVPVSGGKDGSYVAGIH